MFLLSDIPDVVFHEVTHLVQSLFDDHRTRLSFGNLGISFIEAYANLFAYFLSGKTVLGNKLGQMRVYTDEWFGRVMSGRYDSLEPMTSVLVDLQCYITETRSGEKRRNLFKYARAVMKSFFFCQSNCWTTFVF